jgi:uncharacterized protein YndB with AHSA1/START domain
MKIAALLVVVVALTAANAGAEVIDRAAGGFTVKATVTVNAPPQIAYASLAQHIGEWWDSEHTYSGDSKNLSLIAEPGGCMCETLPNAGSVQHGTVVNVAPGQMLRLSAALGPLQQLGVSGSLTWQFARSGASATIATLTYAVGGYAPGGLDTLADIVDMVMTRQLQRLAEHAEKAAGRR